MKKKVLQRIFSMFLCATIFVGSIGLTGCGSNNDSKADSKTEESGGETSKETTKEGESTRNSINIGMSNEAENFDCTKTGDTMTFNVAMQVMETLLNLTEDYEVEAGLAESWEQVDDITYRFKLREGVKFQNGEELKASDAVFSLKRFAESPIMAVQAGNIDPDSFEIEDDYTFTFKNKEPYADTLLAFAFPGSAIISEKEFEAKGGDFSRDPSGMGTGPYKFVEWKSGEYITLERNDDYWDGAPNIEKLTFNFLQDPSTRVIELETGGVDFIYFVPCASLESLESNNDLVINQYPGTTASGFMPKVIDEPFTDIRVRQALSYAIDRTALVKAVFGNGAEAMECGVPSGFAGYQAGMVYPYDKEKAAELLKEAGYSEENPVEFEIWIHDNSEYQKAAEIVQAMWAEVGVNATLKVLEAPAMSAAMAANEQPTTLGAFGSPSGISYEILLNFVTDTIPPKGSSNRCNYSNPEYDELVSQVKVEFDAAKRVELIQKCQQILFDEAIFIPIFDKNIIFAQSNKLEGVKLLPVNRAYFKNAYFTE